MRWLPVVLVVMLHVSDVRADATADTFEQGMQMLEQVAAMVDANKDHCDLMGNRLEAFYEQNAEFVKQAKTTYETIPQEQRRVVQARYRARFNVLWAKLYPGVMKCKDNPKVSSAVQKLMWTPRPST